MLNPNTICNALTGEHVYSDIHPYSMFHQVLYVKNIRNMDIRIVSNRKS